MARDCATACVSPNFPPTTDGARLRDGCARSSPQQYVNHYRAGRKLVSLEEKTEEGKQFTAPDPEPVLVVDSRLDAATGAALEAMPAEDRTMVAGYYIDRLTLARVAKLLGVHESTISRRLEQVVRRTCAPIFWRALSVAA